MVQIFVGGEYRLLQGSQQCSSHSYSSNGKRSIQVSQPHYALYYRQQSSVRYLTAVNRPRPRDLLPLPSVRPTAGQRRAVGPTLPGRMQAARVRRQTLNDWAHRTLAARYPRNARGRSSQRRQSRECSHACLSPMPLHAHACTCMHPCVRICLSSEFLFYAVTMHDSSRVR